MQQFVPAAKELEEKNLTEFQPHYLTHLCPEVYATTQECETQCIHKGALLQPEWQRSVSPVLHLLAVSKLFSIHSI